jgi:hypothetical protein
MLANASNISTVRPGCCAAFPSHVRCDGVIMRGRIEMEKRINSWSMIEIIEYKNRAKKSARALLPQGGESRQGA